MVRVVAILLAMYIGYECNYSSLFTSGERVSDMLINLCDDLP